MPGPRAPVPRVGGSVTPGAGRLRCRGSVETCLWYRAHPSWAKSSDMGPDCHASGSLSSSLRHRRAAISNSARLRSSSAIGAIITLRNRWSHSKTALVFDKCASSSCSRTRLCEGTYSRDTYHRDRVRALRVTVESLFTLKLTMSTIRAAAHAMASGQT